MHELSLAREILEICFHESMEKKIKQLNLRIGELSSVSPESLLFYLENISENSCLQGAKIKYEIIEASLSCDECDVNFKSDDWICPYCGRTIIEYGPGRELEIESIELIDETNED
ncbi:MAG: hydrogenase nickel incorporation protein HypA [candidate division WS2 bacterium]|uniref:Hydrogenase maturation factor HypA n=1 Tax=Psychracetigena formicireducens TaxID=2986056 RepID=A0A9E2BH06_PSYF1|nr:hydrogenase nickel incorporation protein HypA [Candidatus Psychracetigena formicireducens]MBT9144742.1 hydrogenase nickel incorporation protein HypA [Candidatus Psychracetigena formicireducens]MBT9150234.1 hydrogenase nickel incorporation protein HypA [Candidatus Psychracetigena formicireducens]